jgi:DNA ligase D-like protein (predicted polymerase)/DNA ligase D-like protein (predicted ligase)/DNA ligase D-like protein (predicted 3'-phosphoesterase)
MAQVGRRQLELSNLDKVLFPNDSILKAELIEYYLRIAPTILRHIRGRALSLVRYPDGIYGESFFQKNRPDWAPDWIEYVTLGRDKPKDYVLASEDAALVWLANLACIEIHQLHSRVPATSEPDYMVFDIDPPEGASFRDIVGIALSLRTYLQTFAYTPFVKTSGKKGIHVVVPIEPRWPFDRVFEVISEVAKPFVADNSADLTLKIQKNARQGKVLLDIYRNRHSQSIVSPYSVRAADGAPVSMPLTWEQIEALDDPREHNISTVLDSVLQVGDAWEGMAAFAVPLHTEREEGERKVTVLPESRVHKTPQQLEEYARKRTFAKTPEPGPAVAEAEGRSFVVHRHHASHLHYDLRLEQDGTLKSWAVPRGLPPRPGIKRLAVSVEDHPVEYLTFEGQIPKGQYGAGPMWIYAIGRYEVTKEKKDGFYFRLHSPQLTADYRIYRTRDKEWLLERLDAPQVDYTRTFIPPMLAESRPDVPKDGYYFYEMKWDGIRAMVSLDEGELTIRSRSGKDITPHFPELNTPETFNATSGLFDGEIVCLRANGHPDFRTVMGRIHAAGEARILKASRQNPAFCYLFDVVYLDGRPVAHEPLVRRREWLRDAIRSGGAWRVNEIVDDGHAFFQAVSEMGLEGIIAKDPDGKYVPGRRSDTWSKIKVRNATECVILGYTAGKGDRAALFGALHIGEVVDDELVYRGKVGTGFDTKTMAAIVGYLQPVDRVKRFIDEKPPDDKETTWLAPTRWCEVQYASLTQNGTYREPVFLRLRPDLNDTPLP